MHHISLFMVSFLIWVTNAEPICHPRGSYACSDYASVCVEQGWMDFAVDGAGLCQRLTCGTANATCPSIYRCDIQGGSSLGVCLPHTCGGPTKQKCPAGLECQISKSNDTGVCVHYCDWSGLSGTYKDCPLSEYPLEYHCHHDRSDSLAVTGICTLKKAALPPPPPDLPVTPKGEA